MNEKQRASNRKQLVECLCQLADRALELDEKHIYCCINTICGSIVAGDENQFAYFCEAFSRMKVDALEKEEKLFKSIIDDIKPPQSE